MYTDRIDTMNRALLTLAAFIGSLAAAEPSAGAEDLLKHKCESMSSTGECTLYWVSLIELIANPKAYDGKRVRLIGFVRLEFEGNAIYVSKESYEAGIIKNALWLDPPKSSPLARKGAVWGPQYAIVEGRFDARSLGHMRLFSGAIRDTTRLDSWAEREPAR